MSVPPKVGETASLVETPSRPKIHALTSARFFAAMYVVFFHSKWGVAPGSPLDRFLDLGYIAPYFFFLLSGYILSIVYLQRDRAVPARKFYLARFARIYPLYLVSVLADVPFAVLGRVAKYGFRIAIERVAVLLAASTFMMQMWLPTLTVINIPSWSLAIETVFYLSFPLLGPWLWKSGRRTLLSVSGILYIGSILMNWYVSRRKAEHPSGFDLISFTAIFALGILLARWQRLGATAGTVPRATDRAGWSVLVAGAVFFVAVAAAYPWLSNRGINAGFLLAPVYMALIWVLAATRILPVRLLETRWLVVLGEASYGLYLIQVPVMHTFARLRLTGSPWNYPLYLGTCIGLSVLSFYFFETPARQWILHRFHSLSKESMEAASAAQ